MVKELANTGVEYMGKVNSGISWLGAFLFLFVVSAALDFEYSIATVKGNGEVLGHASILMGDILVKRKEVQVPAKLMDVVTVILAMVLAINRKTYFARIKQAFQNLKLKRLVASIVIIFVVAAVSIFTNASEYTNPQLLLMTLYLIKLLQAMVVGIMVATIATKRKICEISSPFLIGVLFSIGLLMLNKFGIIVMSAAAGDRMEGFGVIIFAMIIAIYFHQMESWERTIEISKQWLYAFTVFIGSISILTCGKRGIETTYQCCMIALVLVIYLYKNSGSNRLVLMMFFAFIVSLPNLIHDFNRTLGNSYDSISGAPHRKEIIILIHKDNPAKDNPAEDNPAKDNPAKDNPAKNNQAEGSLLYDFASELDYSGADRICRMIKTLRLSYENNFMGTGFQGVQYKYSYLPDCGLQFLLEIGLAGVLLLFLSVYYLYGCVARSAYISSGFAIVHISLAIGTLAILCVFCNQLYMPRFVMIFVSYMFFSVLCARSLKTRCVV